MSCFNSAFVTPTPVPLTLTLRHSFKSHCRNAKVTAPLIRRSRLYPRSELTKNEAAEKSAQRMSKTIESVQAAFNTIRTGRANPTILDRVMVSYYGVETPLNQLASISVSGTATIVVEPFDKSAITDMERGIQESDIGINPNSDGSVIRLAVPPLTEERRKELAKQVRGLAEDGRVALRNIRRDAVDSLKKLEKSKELGKDESKTMQADVQKLTDKHVKQIDQLLKQKESDIMKV